jgi:hypothetical protein
MDRPSIDPEWAVDDLTNGPNSEANKIEPSQAKKDRGWDPLEYPPRNWLNWWMNLAYQWIVYLKEQTDNRLTLDGTNVATIIRVEHTNPILRLRETDAASNNKVWELSVNTDGVLSFRLGNDALSAYTDFLTLTRTSGSNNLTEANWLDNIVKRPAIQDYAEITDTHGAAVVGATETINIENGNVHTILLDENCTLTFSNPSASGRACSFTLLVKQDGTGGNTITWPASVDWPNAVAPTLTTAGNAVDIFTFFTVDGGTIWYGFIAGQAMG